MPRTVTFQSNPLTLVGRQLKTGIPARDFTAVSQDLKEVRLSDYKGKVRVVHSFPSLDTPVCDMQVKEFNSKAAGFSSDITVLGISKDLPFAQKRFCQANNIANEIILSDYRYSSFGINYGLLIKELNLLARAVIILDATGLVRYFRIVEELTHSLDYSLALEELKKVIATLQKETPVSEARCKPCEGQVASLPKEKIERLLASYRGWSLIEDKKLAKELKFRDFREAKYFLDLLSVIAEEQCHHPVFNLNYNRLKITLTTHASHGLTENDFIMAGIIDELIEGSI